MPVLTATEWDGFLTNYPDAHILQTSSWGEVKTAFGWDVTRVALIQSDDPKLGAQILFRRLPLNFSLAYIAKGPVGLYSLPTDWSGYQGSWAEIDQICQEQRSIFLIVEPDVWQTQDFDNTGETGWTDTPPGFTLGIREVQPSRTLLVDLSGDEDSILSRMKQKTRYNIRLAMKKDVKVSPSADLDLFHQLMTVTGQRDSFGVHSLDYYKRTYELFHPRGQCELLIAEYAGTPLAALMVFANGQRAWYFYGASANEGRDRMPTYLLQWEAMRWARKQGCQTYDLWGVPDHDEEMLESTFLSRSDGLWGVYRFKRGFGGQLLRATGPWDRVYRPQLYKLYRLWAARRKSGSPLN